MCGSRGITERLPERQADSSQLGGLLACGVGTQGHVAWQVSGSRAGFVLACVPGAPVPSGHTIGLLLDLRSHVPNTAFQ